MGMLHDGHSASGDGSVKIHGSLVSRCAGSGLPPVSPAPLSAQNAPLCVTYPGRVGVQLIGRVPRPVREQLARKLAEILDLVISSNSRESWERLFLFCHNCHHIYST